MTGSRLLLAALLPVAVLAAAPAFAQVPYTDFTSAKNNLTIGPGDFHSGVTTAPAAYLSADGGNTGKAYGSDAQGGSVFGSAESQDGGVAGGTSQITFRVTLSGPTTTTFVPIDVVASGYTLATGTTTRATQSNANASASFVVTCNYCESVLIAAANSTYNVVGTPTLTFNQVIGLRTGDFMDISMQVIAESGGGTANAGDAEGFIDPLFIVDPAFAAEGYSVVGVPMPAAAAVPEPATGLLAVVGLALLGVFARRGGRRVG